MEDYLSEYIEQKYTENKRNIEVTMDNINMVNQLLSYLTIQKIDLESNILNQFFKKNSDTTKNFNNKKNKRLKINNEEISVPNIIDSFDSEESSVLYSLSPYKQFKAVSNPPRKSLDLKTRSKVIPHLK